MPHDPLARILSILQQEGFVLASKVRGEQTKRVLEQLVSCQTLTRGSSGRGARYEVNRPDNLERYIASHYPNGFELLSELNATPKAQAVALQKDAHKGKGNVLPIAIRAFGGHTLDINGALLQVSNLTGLAGCAGIKLTENFQGRFSGRRVALVENVEFFFNVESVIQDIELAIYLNGVVSNLLLNWLSQPICRHFEINHCGDYDYVGLTQYCKIKETAAGSVALFVPENIEQLFKKFADPKLMDRQKRQKSVVAGKKDPTFNSIIDLMLKYGGGLHQETLLIKLASDPATQGQETKQY